MSTTLVSYEDSLVGSRQRLKDQPQLRLMMGADAEPQHLHAFLVQWAALTIQVQEPAERLLVAASRRCSEVGEHRLSLALLQIASEAIERYRLVADDTRRLAQLWNQRWPVHLNMTELLTQPPSRATKRLHGYQLELIEGPQPWTQLAVVYEIEAALAAVAQRVRDHAETLLGADVRGCLRSLESIAHFAVRGSLRRAMITFLDAGPERVEPMAAAGEHCSGIYLDFLVECCVAGSALIHQSDPSRAAL